MARPADPNAKIDLLRAAEEVFSERGLDQAKVEQITERAGHSKGSFYLHFSSKEDAFRQIVESTLARLAACLDQAQADVSARLPPAEHVARWRAHDLEMFEFIWLNRRVIKLMMEGGGSTQFKYLIDQFADRSQKACAAVLAVSVQNGLYREDLDVDVAAMLLAGGYDRIAREVIRAEKKPDFEALIISIQRIVLGGMGSRRLAAVLDSEVNNRASKPHARNTVRTRRAARG